VWDAEEGSEGGVKNTVKVEEGSEGVKNTVK
jgi:hypothetical protein